MIAIKKQQGRKLARTLLRWLALVLLLASAHAFAQSAGTVTYVYTDPQGTPLAEADASGNITATFDYTPYGTYAPQGTSAPGPAPSGPGYTGHVNDAKTNLVYMQARYYDPATGRFLSVDPVDLSAGNAFDFNRYVYVDNNPVINTDPNGRQCAQCLYWPRTRQDSQARLNAAASKDALIGTAILAPLIPAAGFVGVTGAAVAADTIATGSLTSGVLLNGPAVVASAGILADTVAGANGIPSPTSGAGEFTPISFDQKLTRFSANSMQVGLTSAEAIDNLAANEYTQSMSQSGSVTMMSNDSQTYTFYPAATGGGVSGAPTGSPSASLTLNGASKAITKLRFTPPPSQDEP